MYQEQVRPPQYASSGGNAAGITGYNAMDMRVRQIIASNPGEWGNAADAIDREFGEGTATRYDSLLKAVYQDGDGTLAGSMTSPDSIAQLPVSDTTKAVMTGTMKLKDLTPTAKQEVATELYRVGFNPQTYVIKKLEGLSNLYQQIPPSYRGILGGRVPLTGSINPTVAQFESAKNILTREVARLNDVGVLSDQDVASYTAAMPSRTDASFDVVQGKLTGIGVSLGAQNGQPQNTQQQTQGFWSKTWNWLYGDN